MLLEGFIKLHRQLNKWRWKTDPNMVALFIHILSNVNYEQRNWKHLVVHPGQIVTSLGGLASATGISVQTIRTCLKRLKSTKEIKCESTNGYHLITLNNWASWQGTKTKSTREITNQLTNDQQTTNKRLTTMKEVKEIKEVKNLSPEEEKIDLGIFKDDEKFLGLWEKYLSIRKKHHRSNDKIPLEENLRDLEAWEKENIGNATASLSNAIKGDYFTLKKPKSTPSVPQPTKSLNVVSLEEHRKMYEEKRTN